MRIRSPGERVVLDVPENPRLHGHDAVVDRLAIEGWGAYVKCDAAATGEFRALWEEMKTPKSMAAVKASEATYSGEICCTCGGSKMMRSGACLTCMDCGTSGGCG